MISNNIVRHMIDENMGLYQFIWVNALTEVDYKNVNHWVDYYARRLIEAKEHLNFLESMTLTDRVTYVSKIRDEKLTMYKKYAEEERGALERCENMLAQVNQWAPPTPNHVDLKNRMVAALVDAINGLSFFNSLVDITENVSTIELFNRQLLAAKTNVLCMEEQVAKHIEEARLHKEWIDALVKQIGLPKDAVEQVEQVDQ